MPNTTAPALKRIARPRLRQCARHPMACIALLSLTITLPAFAAEPFSLDAALAKQQQEQHEAAAADFLALAERGDARGQYLLGVAYLKGQGVPRDYARGYGWLLLASEPYAGQFGKLTADAARRAVKDLQSKLPGSDLIHGEQFAAAFRRDLDQTLSAAKQRAEQAILAAIDGATPTPAEQSANGGPYPGCARDPSVTGCPPAPSPPSENCKGPGVPDNEKTVASGPKPAKPKLDYPADAKRKGLEGSVPVLVQLGRDGRVCQVMLIRSSGVPSLDETALKSVKRWEFAPVTLDGVPISLVDNLWVTFQLSDYAMQ